MNEPNQIILFSLAMIGLGVVALKLPYRFNPFRFKRFVASHLSESTNENVPKVLGWILILMGCLGLLMMLLWFGLNRWIASQDSARAASSAKFAETMRLEEVSLATAVSNGVSDADHFDLLIRKSNSDEFQNVLMNQDGPALDRLKEVFSQQLVAPRTDFSHAMFIVPKHVISFIRNGTVTVQISLSGRMNAFNGEVSNIKVIYQNTLPPEKSKVLIDALPQLKEP